MCAINPEHEMHFKISVYTSQKTTKAEFEELVTQKIFEAEMKLNEDMRLRWHVKDASNAKR